MLSKSVVGRVACGERIQGLRRTWCHAPEGHSKVQSGAPHSEVSLQGLKKSALYLDENTRMDLAGTELEAD